MTKKENRLELADRCLRRSLEEEFGPTGFHRVITKALAYRNNEHRENPEKYEGEDPIPRVFVKLSGGLVQGAVSDVPVKLVVIDYDQDSTPKDELVEIPEQDGDYGDAYCYEEAPLIDAGYCDQLETACEV